MKKLITMLSALTITTSIAPLTVACGSDKEIKGQPIELSKITDDMIINLQDQYETTNNNGEKTTTKSNKIGSLDNSTIRQLLERNLKILINAKITGIDKTKFINQKYEDTLNNSNDAEQKNFSIIQFFSHSPQKAIEITIEEPKENNSKIFTITIKKVSWSEINKNDAIKSNLEKTKEKGEEFLKLDYEAQKKQLFSDEENKPSEEETKKIIQNYIQSANAYQKISIDSIKAIYDLIKDDGATIKIDLTSKQ